MSELKVKMDLPTGATIECFGMNTDVVDMLNMFCRTALKETTDDDVAPKNADALKADCTVVTCTKRDANLEDMLARLKNGSLNFNVGDSFSCTLTDGQRVTFVATEITNDSIRFEMEELLECMPHTDVHAWYDELIETFPLALQDAIIPTIRRYRENGDGDIKEYKAKLFMPSASEVFSESEYAEEKWIGDKGVYKQLEYYKNVRNRIRCAVDVDCSNAWWLLSAHSGSSTNFAVVAYDGGAGSYSASNTWIAAPVCFRICKNL